jgi:hypothetical protein
VFLKISEPKSFFDFCRGAEYRATHE